MGFWGGGGEGGLGGGGGGGGDTPAPWVNVLANENFGTVISEQGSAYTWDVRMLMNSGSLPG